MVLNYILVGCPWLNSRMLVHATSTAIQWFQSYEVPPPPPPLGHYCPWDSPFGVVDCLGALGNESIHEDNLGDDTPFINNNLTLLGSEIRFTQWPSGSKKGTRTSLLFYFKDFFSLGKSCESLVIFCCSPVAKWHCRVCLKTFNEGANKALKDSLPSFW